MLDPNIPVDVVRFSNSEPMRPKTSEQLNDITTVYSYMVDGISKDEYELATDSQKQLISVFIGGLPRAKKDGLLSKLGKENLYLKNGEVAKIQKEIKKTYLF